MEANLSILLKEYTVENIRHLHLHIYQFPCTEKRKNKL